MKKLKLEDNLRFKILKNEKAIYIKKYIGSWDHAWIKKDFEKVKHLLKKEHLEKIEKFLIKQGEK